MSATRPPILARTDSRRLPSAHPATRLPLRVAAIASLLFALEARAYNSEEHKLLVDMAAAKLRLDPSIHLPAPTRFGSVSKSSLLKIHTDGKFVAVGYRDNKVANYDSTRGNVQDNCFWYGYGQREYNFKNYIPPSSDLRDTALVVAAVTIEPTRNTFTIGELAALYGDYRRTVHCKSDGTCHLSDADTRRLGFDGNVFYQDYYCPDSLTLSTYLHYLGNGVVPPFGSLGNSTPGGNSASDNEYMDAGWWGDEMLRIAATNDWHFSSAALSWYVGMHRLALYYANAARTNPNYWNHALHYEAHALHSYTDLFAFGHVVTNRDRTTRGIMEDKGLLDHASYDWMEHVWQVGGASRGDSGQIVLSANLPAISDIANPRNDFMPSYAGNWKFYTLQEKDFHDAFNAGGATVRNLRGERFFINGDGAYRSMSDTTIAVIIEGVRASLQSLFDAYVELGRGRTVAEIGAAGSPYFAALKSLPIFVETNRVWTFEDSEFQNRHIGNNFNGQWVRYAQAADAIAGTDVVPDVTPLPCQIQFVDGAIEFTDLSSKVAPCDTFPTIQAPPPPPPPPPPIALTQIFPNPFGSTTSIRYVLSTQAHVTIEIFDLFGVKVATVSDGVRDAGEHVVPWDVANARKRIRSGLYLCRLTVGGTSNVQRMMLVQ